MKTAEAARQDLLTIYQAALDRVSGRKAVKAALQDWQGDCSLVAIGKAAESMALGALDVLGERVRDGVAISKFGHFSGALLPSSRLQCIEAAHPVPDQSSLQAGEQLLAYLQQLPPERPLLVLISGGASSLVEVLPPGVGAEQLQRMNQWLLSAGLEIDAMNRIRKSVSQIKGGRLISYVGDRPVTLLLISDVPGDDPAVIGSGLLVPEPVQDIPDKLPDWLNEICHLGGEASPGMRDDIEPQVVANLAAAREAAAAKARQLGYSVNLSHAHIGGDVDLVGRRLALEITDGWPALYVWGGEPTVTLPDNPGRGGRNQHLALTVADMIAGLDGVHFLSAGTDGTDGPGEDAGALVDGGTLRRGQLEGFSLDDCLSRADSGSFLEASNDLIHTGPTGTNVMDLMIGLKL